MRYNASCCVLMVYLLVMGAALVTQPAAAAALPRTEEPYCMASDPHPFFRFGKQTAYSLERGNFTHEDLVPEGCEAQQAWHLVRHGARYPNDDDITDFRMILLDIQEAVILAHYEGRGELCEGDLQLLANWSMGGLNESWAQMLTPQGLRDIEQLAVRYKAALPSILDLPFTNDSFKFRHTDTERTEDSAKAYARSIFGHEVYIPDAIVPDLLIGYYRVCKNYLDEVDNNPNATMEETLFEDGPQTAAVVASASQRLGLSLDFSDVKVMYTACRYYKAWDPYGSSPWCVAFTPEDLEVMDYGQDLKYYYLQGYGFPIDYEMACPPLQDLIEHFSDIIEGRGGPKGVFYFTHSDVMLTLMARMGLYEDTSPLTHEYMDPDRRWRTSVHCPYVTNYAFTLSYCDSDSEWRVSLVLSEEVLELPGCSGPRGCTWDEFLATYGRFLDCDLEKICDGFKPETSQSKVPSV